MFSRFLKMSRATRNFVSLILILDLLISDRLVSFSSALMQNNSRDSDESK